MYPRAKLAKRMIFLSDNGRFLNLRTLLSKSYEEKIFLNDYDLKDFVSN